MRNARFLIITALLSATLGLASLTPPGNSAFAQESVPIKGPKNATDQFSGVVYGPITSNDTLWRIAERYRQNNTLSIYQVMVAIYELNPSAFEKQNLNLMVDGAMLQLPSERFIARIDAEKAKQRAEQDDASWEKALAQPGDPIQNLKPPSPPVNQDDLAITKNAIEEKLNTLDASQAAQFDALREQFAQSVSSVESLLEDNQKLYERIDKVNTDLDALRTQVEGDVQTQMEEQSSLINEMLSLMRQEQQQREEKEAASIMSMLSSPTAIITISALLTLSLLVAAGMWLLKRKNNKEPEAEVSSNTETTEKAMDLAPADDFADEPLGQDDELADDDLFNDDDLLDDVLSSELEESLDDELESFADLSDEMLVSDEQDATGADDSLFEEGDSELNQDDLDSLFEDESLSADLDEGDGIDISMQDDDLLDNLSQESDAELMDEMLDDDEISDIADVANADEATDDAADTTDESDTVTVDAIEPADEAPEIDIDELLEENAEQNIAEKLGVDENNLDEDMLSKIDDEIQQQGQELDKLTDNIIGEIEQLEMMGGMLDEMDEDDDESIEVPESGSHGPQDLDSLAEDLEDIQVEDMANADDFADPLSDELLAELKDDDVNDLTDELLQELDSEPDKVDESDALADELLSELEQEADPLDDLSEELLSELDSEASAVDPQDSLADELLDELESELDPNDALSDELLDELEADAPVEEEQLDSSDDLSEELLAELEADTPVEEEPAETADTAPEELLVEPEAETPVEEEQAETADAASDEQLAEPEAETSVEEEPTEAADTASEELLDEPEAEIPVEEEPTETAETASEELLDEPEAETPVEEDLIESSDALDDALLDELEDAPVAEQGAGDALADEALNDLDTLGMENIDDFTLEQEQDGVLPQDNQKAGATSSQAEDISDVPGIDDWLAENPDSTDTAILDELENTDFDDLLSTIDEEVPETVADEKPKLDNPDLDLDALLNDFDEIGEEVEDDSVADDFVSVESLIDEADQDDSPAPQDDFDLDVSLDEFTGSLADNDMIDVDLDASQAANLDLARAYIDMDDFSAARGLLNEVLEQGNEEQIEEAKSLLQELGDA